MRQLSLVRLGNPYSGSLIRGARGFPEMVVDRGRGRSGYHKSATTEATASAPAPGSEGIDVPQAPMQAMGFRARRSPDESPDAEPPPAYRKGHRPAGGGDR
ncbi:hypothetical protein MSEO_14210 [Mycobacterium seoulense]|uniref:Uncharacterized protein n=1 Tax=Mycobacterium seoulense TaxID=386911 RepID=A0A7I7NYM7_9MYCO|nr:hypothetical protein MSEO_14210 [Mycobacterium seoulense]